MKINWNFQKGGVGGRVQTKTPSVRGVEIFSWNVQRNVILQLARSNMSRMFGHECCQKLR